MSRSYQEWVELLSNQLEGTKFDNPPAYMNEGHIKWTKDNYKRIENDRVTFGVRSLNLALAFIKVGWDYYGIPPKKSIKIILKEAIKYNHKKTQRELVKSYKTLCLNGEI